MVALAARTVSRSSPGLPHATPSMTPSKRRGALLEEATGCSPPAADSAGAAERQAAAGRVDGAAGGAGVLGVGGVAGAAGAAGAARAAGVVGVAGPAPSSCGAASSASSSASSAASWKA